MSHSQANSILCDNQHKFRKRRSYETKLSITLHGIARKMQIGKSQVDVILLNFWKLSIEAPAQAWVLLSEKQHTRLDQGFPNQWTITGPARLNPVITRRCSLRSSTGYCPQTTPFPCLRPRICQGSQHQTLAYLQMMDVVQRNWVRFHRAPKRPRCFTGVGKNMADALSSWEMPNYPYLHKQ